MGEITLVDEKALLPEFSVLLCLFFPKTCEEKRADYSHNLVDVVTSSDIFSTH